VSYIQKTLIAGESVLYRAHLHWVVLFWHALIGTILTVVGVALLTGAFAASNRDHTSPLFGAIGGGLLIAVGAAVITAGVLRRNATEIAVTNKRVLIKTGFFGRTTIEIFLSKIESVVVDESFLGKALGFGSVTVRGTGGTPERFDRIASPLEFRRQVQGQIEGGVTQIRTA
jgi:uncharacterized membrane protein YdbT with pleckstrin-like domain